MSFDPLEVERLETQLRMQRDQSARYADRRMWEQAWRGLDTAVGRLMERGLGSASTAQLARLAEAVERLSREGVFVRTRQG